MAVARLMATQRFRKRLVEIESMPEPAAIDCRSEVGVAVGLVDSIITAARVLAGRDLAPVPVREALADLRSDEDIARLLAPNTTYEAVDG